MTSPRAWLYPLVMRGSRSAGWATLRAAIVLAALYALALQGLLGGVLAAEGAGALHRLCVQDSGTGPDGSGQPVTPHSHLPCCTAAHLPHPVPARPAPETDVAWPVRRVAGLAWRAEIVAIPRAPPRAVPSARGPPTA